MLAQRQGVNPACSSVTEGLPDGLPVAKGDALVFSAPAAVQSGAPHWEDQLFVRDGQGHWGPVDF